MPREELISSAVTFLQDPSVSSAPLEKKVAFLQSKNLTQEEIDIALSRAGENSSSVSTTSQIPGYAPQQQAGNRPVGPPSYQSYPYGPGGQWQAPPPELPKRDWRDWFIMATVMGGVGYGLYCVAKRYIVPLIAPPTPPQLQQDKENIDEQFNRAFALLDQLAADTASLKAAEDARTERLDAALRDVEDVVAELKASSRRRDDETRRISDEVKSLKDGIPRAIEGAKEGNEKRLKELSSELKSLKVLLGNRLGSMASSPATTSVPRPASVENPSSQPNTNGVASGSQQPNSSTAISSPATPKESTSSPFAQLGKPASIPAWQMAAANKSTSAATTSSDSAPGSSSTSNENQQSSAPPS
ncbi:hypothetical protein VTO42DRAFT_4755 [Malbranchea cinnamomea]